MATFNLTRFLKSVNNFFCSYLNLTTKICIILKLFLKITSSKWMKARGISTSKVLSAKTVMLQITFKANY